MASNLGGMTSPISSPQNIFAIQEMGRGGNSVSWLSWFAVALPIAFIGNLICWGALLAVYRPMKTLKEVRRLPDTEVSLKLTLRASAPGSLCQSLQQSFQAVLWCLTAVSSCTHYSRLPMHAQDPVNWKQVYVMVISLGTVALWCANSALDKYLGQMGIVAIIPMVFFFGFGLLNKASTLLCHISLLGSRRRRQCPRPLVC